MMKKIAILLLILPLLLTGCQMQENSQVAATTLPVYDFTAALCQGTGITVCRLITENVSCLHDYSVQVHQMRMIEQAEAVICSGAGLEDFLSDVLIDSKVIDASDGITLHCGHNHENDEHTHEADPHIWLSPANAMQMCKTICKELSNLYPSHTEQFQANLNLLLERLDVLQSYGESNLQDISCRELITFHDGFSYFAESFGLHILKAVEEESGSEASAKELIELIDLVNSNRLPAIFTETNGSTAAAEIIAKETGTRIYTLDMAMAGNSYFAAMYHNIDTVKEALE